MYRRWQLWKWLYISVCLTFPNSTNLYLLKGDLGTHVGHTYITTIFCCATKTWSVNWKKIIFLFFILDIEINKKNCIVLANCMQTLQNIFRTFRINRIKEANLVLHSIYKNILCFIILKDRYMFNEIGFRWINQR